MKLRRLVIVLLIACGSGVLAFGIAHGQFFESTFGQFELTTLDWRVRAATGEPPRANSEIALILFDSASVGEWPFRSPFPRSVLAELVEMAAAAGARTIGLDVHLDRRYPELDPLGNGDERLRDAIRRAGNVILAVPTEQVGSGRVLHRPDPYFADVAAGIGTADLPTPFEVIRDAALTVRTDQGLIPGFSLALYAHARGLDPLRMMADAELTGSLEIPGLPDRYARLPPRERAVHNVPILFVGPPSRMYTEDGAFLAMPSAFAGFMAELFRDRIVLLGTGSHVEEQFRTPFYDHVGEGGEIAGWMYGVEVHAHALENLLTGRHPVPLRPTVGLVLLLALALLVSGMTFWRGAGWGAAAAAAAFALVFGLAFALFNTSLIHLPLVGSGLALAFAFLTSTSYVSVVEGQQNREIRSAFSRYVSPAVVDQLVADPRRLRLGGEKRTVTILFSDIAGFTALSETMPPERLLSLLNRYLDEMTRIVMDEGGTLDKYIGDGIMVLYGAPADQADHALRACRTALRMQRRLRELNGEWHLQGLPELSIRIGINTGTPVVGNIGGSQRFDYTALGDAVNLAARLEPACTAYGVRILIAEATREAAGAEIRARELDLLAVFGRAGSVPVFELFGLADDRPRLRPELLEPFGQGIAAYRQGDFALALEYFQAVAEIDPADPPTSLYLQRCRRYIADPPGDWDAVERRGAK